MRRKRHVMEESAEDAAMREIWLSMLPAVFDKLSEQDKLLLGHTYGIFGMERIRPVEIAVKLGCSTETVYRELQAAMHRLREFYQDDPLRVSRRAYVDTVVAAKRGPDHKK